jgi:hypothetical protein
LAKPMIVGLDEDARETPGCGIAVGGKYGTMIVAAAYIIVEDHLRARQRAGGAGTINRRAEQHILVREGGGIRFSGTVARMNEDER